jgi:hypothetical protein
MVERFTVSDEIAWGKLVKSWATGRSYFVEGQPAPPIPRTLQDLKDRCAEVGIEVSIPAIHKGLVVVESSEEVFMIKLPSKTLVEATEQELAAGGGYPLPKSYDDFYRRFGVPLNITDLPSKLDFHAARIGDYSIRMCG